MNIVGPPTWSTPMLRRFAEDLFEILSLTAFMGLVAVVAHSL